MDAQLQSDRSDFNTEVAHTLKAALDAVNRLKVRIVALETKVAALSERPQVKYLGVHRGGAMYSEGSLVTRDGSIFHANKTTSEMPGDGCQDWQLAVKRGRDGKDATGK